MRYSLCRSSAMKNGKEDGQYSEEIFRREFEKAIRDGHVYGVPLKKGKRFRSAFTTEQVNYLEKEFHKYPYIGNARRKDVSNVLNIPERAVKIWFQNRRMKEKKDVPKESEDKPLERTSSNKEVNLDVELPSNSTSLPMLTERDNTLPNIADNGVISFSNTAMNVKNKPATNMANFYKAISPKRDFNFPTPSPPQVSTTVIKNNPAMTRKLTEVYKRYKVEAISDEEDKEDATASVLKDTRQNVLYKPEQFNVTFTPPSVSPQDLSAKPSVQQQKETGPKQTHYQHPDMKPSAELPLYLKGFYAQPYIPPGNMIWKPVNVAPLMTPMPAMSMPLPTVSQQNMKRGCNCDCHVKPTPVPAPMFYHQNNPNPNLQYVITAVPFQNSTPKF